MARSAGTDAAARKSSLDGDTKSARLEAEAAITEIKGKIATFKKVQATIYSAVQVASLPRSKNKRMKAALILEDGGICGYLLAGKAQELKTV